MLMTNIRRTPFGANGIESAIDIVVRSGPLLWANNSTPAFHELFEVRLITIGDADSCARLGEGFGQASAEKPERTGDDDTFAVEVVFEVHGTYRDFGLRYSLSRSPMRLTESTRRNRQMPGNVAIHQALVT